MYGFNNYLGIMSKGKTMDESVNNMTVIYTEDVKVLHDDRYIHLKQDFEFDKPVTLGDLLIKIGYTKGTVIVIAESYLSGTVYRYSNHKQGEWEIVGGMKGFA